MGSESRALGERANVGRPLPALTARDGRARSQNKTTCNRGDLTPGRPGGQDPAERPRRGSVTPGPGALLRAAGCMPPQNGADDVSPRTTTAFDLPDRLSAKADPALIAI